MSESNKIKYKTTLKTYILTIVLYKTIIDI